MIAQSKIQWEDVEALQRWTLVPALCRYISPRGEQINCPHGQPDQKQSKCHILGFDFPQLRENKYCGTALVSR
jgi:hypothetical protein